MPPETSRRTRPAARWTHSPDFRRRHVIEQHAVGAGQDGVLQFLQGGDFHFHVVTRRALLERAFNGGANPSYQAQVVPLDQDAIVQAQAVISPAAHAHRVFLQAAQTGRGLAGVKEFRARSRQLLLQPAGVSGNAAEVLQKIQRHALAGQQRIRCSR